MRDYIIETDATITFAVQYGGHTVLDEEYVPDAENRVKVRDLGKFCELNLWGVWCDGENTPQPDASGEFVFLINGTEDLRSVVMMSRLQTRKDATSPGILSEVSTKVARTGCKEYVSGYLMSNPGVAKNYGMQLTGYWEDGGTETVFLTQSTSATGVSSAFTFDVSPDVVSALFSRQAPTRYLATLSGGSMLFYLDSTRYAEVWCLRFKNVYDMPETVTATGGLKVTGNNESDLAMVTGTEQKFGVRVTDEYTVNSGAVFLQSDYRLWHHLANSREAEIWTGTEWIPIVITKQKYEREFRRSVMTTVEISFTMARPEQNCLIELI